MSTLAQEEEWLRVLDFWWMVELFSPQSIPKVSGKATRIADRQVVEWAAGDPLPWEVLRPPRPADGSAREWRHTVHLGVYALEATYTSLQRVFGEDKNAYDERPGGVSACAGIVVNGDGRLVATSAVLSSALWAAARIHGMETLQPRLMVGFDTAAHNFVEAVDALEGERRDDSYADEPLPAPARPWSA